jgi:hypothetical protein
MGFHEAIVPYGKKDATGRVAFDVNRKMILLYVYCNIATDSVIGDARARSCGYLTFRANTVEPFTSLTTGHIS